jgi:HAD superfamily phosphatase (TIGR01668 family)
MQVVYLHTATNAQNGTLALGLTLRIRSTDSLKALAYSLDTAKTATPSYLPDFTARSVADIDFDLLKKLKVRHLLFDLDQTLRRPYSRHLEDAVVELLKEVQSSGQFLSLNLVSNNQRKLNRFSDPIDANVYQPYREGFKIIRKPNPKFFEFVLDHLNTTPEQTVMIGDRLHADVLGGNRMGMYTIFVTKRGPIDYWFDWLLLTRMRDNKRLKNAISLHRKRSKHK